MVHMEKLIQTNGIKRHKYPKLSEILKIIDEDEDEEENRDKN